METLRITRHSEANVDPKQLLRAQVEEMPVEKQYEFIMAAYQLMADRIELGEVELWPKSKLLS